RDSGRLLAGSDKPGPLERSVRRALTADFLAPLVAATLFSDFSQRFIPWPIASLDRARSLEYTLESTGAALMKSGTPAETVSANNGFERSFLDLWDANGSSPALLINTTDAGSGRRFVIAPFRFNTTSRLGPAVSYQFWDENLPDGEQARDLRLSTAAFVSARFPWVTPAATTVDSRFDPKTLKLVDGGYVDNSGVESALDLGAAIDKVAKAKKANLNLIALTGG